MSAREGAGVKKGAGVEAVARARTQGKVGRGAGRPAGAGAGVTAEMRETREGINVTANLVARRKREKTKSCPGLGPGLDLNPRKKSE